MRATRTDRTRHASCRGPAPRIGWRGFAHGALAALVLVGAIPLDACVRVVRAAEAVPRNVDELGLCLGSGPIRLRTRYGPIEVATIVRSDSGVTCLPRPSDPRWHGDTLRLGWRDIEAVQTRSRPLPAEGERLGMQVGFGVGVVTMILASRHRQGSAADFVLPLAWAIGAIPFAVVGAAVGRNAVNFGEGWVTCARVRWPHESRGAGSTPPAADR